MDLYRFSKNGLLNLLFLTSLILLFTSIPSVCAETQLSDDVVVLNTPSGKMVIELFQSDAPKTTSNFIELTKQKFYDGTIFHRIIKDFMIQGGDPNTKDTKKILQWGYGNSGHMIPAEFNDIMHKRGIVSMARSDDPNSASSQFFIVHRDSTFLDQKYTVFGRLATQESYDALDKIAILETTGASNNYLPTDLFNAQIQNAKVQKRNTVTNLLDLGEPQRVIPKITETTSPYSDEDLGISFNTSSIWTIKKTAKTDPRQPDITIFGPDDKTFTPRILVFIKNSTANSLEDFSSDTRKLYSKIIDDGSLVITSDKKAIINDRDVWIRDSTQKFESTDGTLNLQYRETTFKEGQKFYTITYANTINNFETSLPYYAQILDSLNITKSMDQNSGCLVATAAFGSELAPQVQLLREVRDNVLFTTGSGTAFMAGFNEFYYAFSPTVADWERQSPLFKEAVKTTITPMLSTMSILNYADIHSEQQMMGYGIGVILLNIGMYFVAPTIIVMTMRKSLFHT